jgi:hypothetical protein
MTDEKSEARRPVPEGPRDETDIADERMGRNKLKGDDQASVRNQRHAVPDVRKDAGGVVETAESTDKDVRARRDLGKGKGVHPGEGDDTER